MKLGFGIAEAELSERSALVRMMMMMMTMMMVNFSLDLDESQIGNSQTKWFNTPTRTMKNIQTGYHTDQVISTKEDEKSDSHSTMHNT